MAPALTRVPSQRTPLRSSTYRGELSRRALPCLWALLGGCAGEPLDGSLSLPELTVDFGAVLLGSAAEEVVSLPALGGGVLVTGGEDGVFDFADAPELGDGSLRVRVRFAPRSLGAASGRLEVVGELRQALVVFGLGVTTEAITATPAGLDFGEALVGRSEARWLRLHNPGLEARTVVVSGIPLCEGAPSPFCLARAPGPLHLAPHAEEVLRVRFQPLEQGWAAGSLVFSSCEDPACALEVPLSGYGRQGVLHCGPTRLDFGRVPIGGQYGLHVVCENDDAVPHELTPRVTTGVGFRGPVGAHHLAPGARVRLRVLFFSGDQPGPFEGSLILDSTAKERSIALAAEVVPSPPCDLEVTPATRDFGLIGPGTVAQQVFSVLHRGRERCLVGGVVLEQPLEAFSLDEAPHPWRWLEPGARFEIPVSFGSRLPGAYAGQLELWAAGGSVSVPLSGVVVAGALRVQPEALDFGPARLGCPGPPARAATLVNTGAWPLTLTRVAVTGRDEGDFRVHDVVLPATLPPGDSVEVWVTMRPSAVDDRRAELRVEAEGGEGLQLARAELWGVGQRIWWTDEFQLPRAPDVDVLLVIDASAAMTPWLPRVEALLEAQFPRSRRVGAALRFAVTHTDTSPAGLRGQLVTPTSPLASPVVSTHEPDASRLVELVRAAVNGSTRSEGLEAVRLGWGQPLALVEPPFPDPERLFSVLVISPRDDTSPRSLAAYTQLFTGRPGASLAALVGPPGGCDAPEGRAEDGEAYRAVAEASGGESLSLCAPGLEHEGVYGLRRSRFPLSRTPSPGTLAVFVGGARVEAVDGRGVRVWTYDPTHNHVDFEPGWPGVGAHLRFVYEACD